MAITKSEKKTLLDNAYRDFMGPEVIPVFGEGNLNAKIVFIGEAPGSEEEKLGRPFVGRAGKNLSEFLELAKVPRSSVYITNAVKFRPTKHNPNTGRTLNRTPTLIETAPHREWLLSELEIIQPQLVVTLGNTPLTALLGTDCPKISQVHGLVIAFQDANHSLHFDIMPFFHPAAIIYRRALLAEYHKDLEKFASYIAEHFPQQN